jgi:hypothetical protein
MKTKRCSRSRAVLISTLLAAIFVAGCATTPAPVASASSGRLMITRSFALAGLPVALMVDRVRVATIEFHSSYNGLMAPGPHTINVVQIPDSACRCADPIRFVVQPRQTYKFTATKSGPRVVLR